MDAAHELSTDMLDVDNGLNSATEAADSSPDSGSLPTALNGHSLDHDEDESPHANGNGIPSSGIPNSKVSKPKQKRNKPTLSCLECVERKTKCDRSRPCLACVKRQSECEYTPVANLIASASRKNSTTSNGKARFVTRPPTKIRKTSAASSTTITSPVVDNGWGPMSSIGGHRHSRSMSTSSPHTLGNVPFSKSSPSYVFGVGSQHPFSNYWTCQGGLPEVISVMPSKQQADILIAKYFECVDPVHPFLHRRSFYADYERFWDLPQHEKGESDASFIALHYAMYALGTQFLDSPSYEERSQTAEFYCSAANQALRVYSYLNRTSIRAIQAMLLMAYFLMNDNHASDAYAWAGIHLRQAYAMRLHRDPERVCPDASVLEKQQRRKLWQAVFFQDTFLTTLLQLPPTATHSDVPVESLANEHELSMDGLDSCLGAHTRVENLMSINVIAPQACEPLAPPLPHHILDPATMKNDVTYMRCMWHLGNLVQENLSSPSSLSQPLAHSPRHKESLISAFKRLYKSFPAYLTQLDYGTLQHQATLHPRGVRQNLFLTSNYYHCLMLLHASENGPQGVIADVKSALEAAHEALWAFFKLWGIFEGEAGVWWSIQHSAWEESLLIGHLLSTPPAAIEGTEAEYDPIYDKAKEDMGRMLEIMERYGGSLEIHSARKEALQEAYEKVTI